MYQKKLFHFVYINYLLLGCCMVYNLVSPKDYLTLFHYK